ncbi:MAG TPA: NAD(P)-binding protein, partial [Myxococcota bacterium]|nr:NAD(P)-binding protein [Myxococcota bacterium]
MTTSTHDLVIVGGGIGGVIALRYARAHGLSAVVLEQQGGVGGLWRTLPAWQDLQILKEDWTLGDVPIAGEDAASVRANIQAWVERFALADAIVTGCRVTGAEWRGEHWEVQSTQGPFRGRFLVAATGAHNRPLIPEVTRRSSTMAEYHSSTL